MRKISLVILTIFLFSCSQKENTTEEILYYPFSLNQQINNAIDLPFNSSSACKTVILDNIIDCKKISKEDISTDLESFREFDINKAAWQKSFVEIKNINYTRFKSIEERLPLQYIDVYGNLKKPDNIRIYFHNKNNLYESVKLIEWKPGISYSIFSIQDVKGMDADTLFVKTSFTKQSITKSSTKPDEYHLQASGTICSCIHK